MINLVLPLSIRAVRSAASAPKKQKLANEWPLGKLYDSGAVRSKKGTGRGLLKVNFRVVFKIAAPPMVIANSHASRRHFRDINHKNKNIVADARAIVEPTKDNPRIVAVSAGVANWCAAALVTSSKRLVSPSSTSSVSQAKNTSADTEAIKPSTSRRLESSNEGFFSGATGRLL